MGRRKQDYRDNYLESLRAELVESVQQHLSPIALEYHYSEVPLEVSIKWRPVVLVLGNYSSGKSTLINELLGARIQDTGQAPTDDAFTVLTLPDKGLNCADPVATVEQRDGKVLLYDDRYPFKRLRRYGERFASHFRLKKVNSPFLSDLAIIDTPGMLDSSAEGDRGYDYQEVIGDLAQIADLILVLFDPHKAGTVLEAHQSLRETLPGRTFEDRVVFVLNRIDECSNLNDLLRVYGTLCWNLSQMTRRKDIPAILLTYAREMVDQQSARGSETFLPLLKNQREELKHRILQAPHYRLDHLASYIETHGERLIHFLEALIAYRRRRNLFVVKFIATLLMLSGLSGLATWLLTFNHPSFQSAGEMATLVTASIIGVIVFVTGILFLRIVALAGFHRNRVRDIDFLTKKHTQARRDTWAAVRDIVANFLNETRGKISGSKLRSDLKRIHKIYEKGSKEARDALAELDSLSIDETGQDSSG